MSRSAERVARQREKLRSQGLRPVQIWVPDIRKPGFSEEIKRQLGLVESSDADCEDLAFIDASMDWSE